MSLKTYALKALQKLWRTAETKTAKKVFMVLSVLMILVVGVPVVFDAIAHVSYKGSDYMTAQKIWRTSSIITWYDRDVPPANAGISYYKAGMFSPAVDQLEVALTRASPKRNCSIRWNLAIALDARAGERTASQPNDAIGDYSRAINVLGDVQCLNDPNYKDKFQQLSSGIDAKMQALIKQISAQHERPADNEKKDTKPTDDGERTKQENKQQVEYQNEQNRQRYDQQTDEEKDKSYKERAW